MKPPWLKVKPPGEEEYLHLKKSLAGLPTVCERARCPNLGECWSHGAVTFLILGDACTRNCHFCAVPTLKQSLPPDPDEPLKLAETAEKLNLEYAVITSVDRDDLPDGGASHYARCIQALKSRGIKVEALIPDFQGDIQALARVVEAGPEIVAHNLETTRRLHPVVRDIRASYTRSLQVLREAGEMGATTKSSLMLGLGETKAEVLEAMEDLHSVGVSILTLGQYLQPSKDKLAVSEYIPPWKFEDYRTLALEMGFREVVAGPLVRSSYQVWEYRTQDS